MRSPVLCRRVTPGLPHDFDHPVARTQTYRRHNFRLAEKAVPAAMALHSLEGTRTKQPITSQGRPGWCSMVTPAALLTWSAWSASERFRYSSHRAPRSTRRVHESVRRIRDHQRPIDRPRDTPASRAISRFECTPVENRWRILAQSSNLITFHDGRWPCFQLALIVLRLRARPIRTRSWRCSRPPG